MHLADEHRFPVWLAQAEIMRGYVLAARGEAAQGIALGRQGLAERSATGSTWNHTYYVALLANSYGSAGQVDVALDLLTGALETATRTGERWFEAEIHRHIGEWLMAQAQHAEAEARFQSALAVAREQKARFWELRAATSLARLWSKQKKRSEARDLIAPVYGCFTEGFDTPDLKDAKAVLEDVRD